MWRYGGVEATVSWNLVDHDMWTRRAVAQVSTEWADGEWRWAAYCWVTSRSGRTVCHSAMTTPAAGIWKSAVEAQAAVDDNARGGTT